MPLQLKPLPSNRLGRQSANAGSRKPEDWSRKLMKLRYRAVGVHALHVSAIKLLLRALCCAVVMQEWAKAEAAAIEAQHAAAAARLEAEREAARKLHEEETARAAAELQRLEQERLAILQKQRQMDAEAADKAWLSIAARRIQRAWHSYLTSPAHAIKIKRVVTMQVRIVHAPAARGGDR
jgi:hypothetical protein